MSFPKNTLFQVRTSNTHKRPIKVQVATLGAAYNAHRQLLNRRLNKHRCSNKVISQSNWFEQQQSNAASDRYFSKCHSLQGLNIVSKIIDFNLDPLTQTALAQTACSQFAARIIRERERERGLNTGIHWNPLDAEITRTRARLIKQTISKRFTTSDEGISIWQFCSRAEFAN